MADTIRVIFFRDCEIWAAQCIEYDIGAQAEDLDTLRLRLAVALEVELAESIQRGGEPFAGIDPAPARFGEMWDRRSKAFAGDPGVQLRAGDCPVNVSMGLAA